MQKTTIYIPADVKWALGQVAAARGVSEAELIREALQALISQAIPPRPRLPLFKSGKPRLAERVDDVLTGSALLLSLAITEKSSITALLRSWLPHAP
jgi:hypothetical protein